LESEPRLTVTTSLQSNLVRWPVEQRLGVEYLGVKRSRVQIPAARRTKYRSVGRTALVTIGDNATCHHFVTTPLWDTARPAPQRVFVVEKGKGIREHAHPVPRALAAPTTASSAMHSAGDVTTSDISRA